MFTSISPHAHQKRARFGHAQAIIRRARAGVTSVVKGIFCLQFAPKHPLLSRAMDALQIADGVYLLLICPTCQMFFLDNRKSHIGGRRLLYMGLFSIFLFGAA